MFQSHKQRGKVKKVKGPKEKEEEETKYPLAFHAEGKNIIRRFLIGR